MANYPKLRKKLGLIGALCLLVWGFAILGMQVYVFTYYSQVYGEGTGDDVWGNAYNGMALANSATCLLIALYYILFTFTVEPSTRILLWGMILAVIGAGAAIASTVMTAIASAWINVRVNTESDHPCKFKVLHDSNPIYPSDLYCNNWLGLEVTVSVLSGLALSEYIFIACIIFLGLSGGKQSNTPITPFTKLSHTPIARVNNNNGSNPMNRTSGGFDGPYNAYTPSSPVKSSPSSVNQYDEHNPQYSYHLQQLALQQQAQQQASNKMPSSRPSSVIQEPVQRGRLQILHNQRQRAPPPPVPAKPSNSSNMYRY